MLFQIELNWKDLVRIIEEIESGDVGVGIYKNLLVANRRNKKGIEGLKCKFSSFIFNLIDKKEKIDYKTKL